MLNNILSFLNNWNATKNERQKLQHALLVLTVVIVLAAGIISLFNASMGHDTVRFALFALGAYAANAIVWNLLQSSVLAKLSTKPKRS